MNAKELFVRYIGQMNRSARDHPLPVGTWNVTIPREKPGRIMSDHFRLESRGGRLYVAGHSYHPLGQSFILERDHLHKGTGCWRGAPWLTHPASEQPGPGSLTDGSKEDLVQQYDPKPCHPDGA